MESKSFVNYPVEFMRFTLYYDGPLPSAANSARLSEKQLIRKSIHPQLLELFSIDPNLPKPRDGRGWSNWMSWDWPVWEPPNVAFLEERAVFPVGELKFVPLIRSNIFLHCELDVLFLRRGNPGSIIKDGDIDNRLLTLADGLRLPKGEKEIDYVTKQNNFPPNNPIFCLLEDDSLISRWNVKTDRLLLAPSENPSNVRLVIEVRIKASESMPMNIGLSGD